MTQRPNIVLIVLDTARADAFDLLEGGRTPFLAEIAHRSIVFRNAASTFDVTRPSHHSMLTGFYAGSADPEYDQAEHSIAFLLRELGYLTIGVSANGLLSQETFNSVKSFESYSNLLEEVENHFPLLAEEHRAKLEDVHQRFGFPMFDGGRQALDIWLNRLVLTDAKLVITRLGRVLSEYRDDPRPRFIFLNFLDAHDPYAPDDAFYQIEQESALEEVTTNLRSRPLPESDFEQRTGEIRERERHVPRNHLAFDLSPGQLEIYRQRYQAEISQLDGSLQVLFTLLQREHVLQSSVVFITSDHGESFGEDGFVLHGLGNRGDFEATRHVPLIVVPPGAELTAPLVVDEEVSIADIRPTIDALVGVEVELGHRRVYRRGRSLVNFAPALFSIPPTTVRLRLDEGHALDLDREKILERLRSMGYLAPAGND